MEHDPRSTRDTKPGASLYALYMFALGASLMGNLLVRVGAEGGWLPPAGRVAVAIVTVIPLGAAAVLFRRLLNRELDEMVQRIVLEGFAFALIVYIPLAALYVNLRAAGAWTPRLDAPDVLLVPALLVAIGITIAWQRVR